MTIGRPSNQNSPSDPDLLETSLILFARKATDRGDRSLLPLEIVSPSLEFIESE